MAKPKTKGAPIQIRLDLSDDSLVRLRAEDAGLSPAEWIARQVVAELRGVQRQITGRGRRPVIAIEDPAPDHRHKKKRVNDSSLWVCECGAIRGVDGNWR